MKTTKSLMAVCLLSIGMIFLSCKKETGPTGPQGAQGPAGATGPTGNSNVTTAQYTVSAASWVLGCSSTCWSYSWSLGGFPNNITNGAVITYVQSGTEFIALPFTVSDIEYYYTYSSSSINFRVRSATGNTAISNPGDNVFKVVYIPPGMVKPIVNLKNYSEVQKAYNIQ